MDREFNDLHNEQQELILRLEQDFQPIMPNPEDKAASAFALKYFSAASAYIKDGIINKDNFVSGSKLLRAYYNNIMKHIPEIVSQNSFEVSNFLDHTLGAKFSSWNGNYTLSGADRFKRLGIFNEAVTYLKDFEKVNFLADGIGNYLRRDKRLSDDFVTGIKENMIPQLNKDGEVTAEDNLWGLYCFDMGISDFKYKALTSRITPKNLGALMQYYKEMPATDWATFNQNRLDGLALQNINKTYSEVRGLETLRDTIHSQRPQTADLIHAIVSYYDAVKNNGDIEAAKREMTEINKKNIGYEIEEKFLSNIENYEVSVSHEKNEQVQEPVIDILRRLDKNMHQTMSIPQLEDAPLQKAAETVGSDKHKLGIFLKMLNNRLEKNILDKKVGIPPEMVHLLIWADKKCAETVNNLDYEYQRGAYKEPWFKEALKFNCLTNSGRESFSPQAFNRYYEQIKKSAHYREAYQKLSRLQYAFLRRNQRHYLKEGIGHLIEAFPKISAQEAAHTLSKSAAERGEVPVLEKFKEGKRLSASEKKTALIIQQYHTRLDSMASGNLINALQGLMVQHAPSTKIGAKYYREETEITPVHLRCKPQSR